MKNYFKILLLLGAISLAKGQQDLVPLTIFHWNDFHAANEPYRVTIKDSLTSKDTSYFVGGTATFLSYLNKFKSASPNSIMLNAGDDFQGTPISSITFGRSQIELLNIINPTAMTLGNHEFDYGSEKLRATLKLSRFRVISANIYDKRNHRTFVEPSRILQTGRLKIGLIGLTHPQLESLVVKDSLVGLVMLGIDSVVSVHIQHFKQEKVDLIVALTHIGLENDSLLAQKHPELDVIVGGHDHIPLFNPVKVNKSLIVQAGSRGRWLGKLDLLVDSTGDSLFSYAGKLIETRVSEVTPDSVAARKVEELVGSLKKMLSEVIGELKTPWIRVPDHERKESNIGNWQSEVMREYALTDIAFQNAGGIRTNLPAGPITVGDIWKMNPFGNHFVTFEVDGETLKAMLEFQVATSTQEWCQVGGIRYKFDSRKPTGERIVSIEVNAQPIDPRKKYTVVTNNYVASNLNVHFGIDPGKFHFKPLPKLDRDVFIDKIQQQKVISSAIDGRIEDIGTTNK